MTPHVIRTRRLILRPLVTDDAVDIVPLIGDFEVAKWLTHVPHPYSMGDAVAFIDSDINRAGDNWAIEYERRVVGVIGGVTDLGYWLGRPYWRQGIMREAARAVVDAIFTDPKADKLTSGHFEGNAGSRTILTGLGFADTHFTTVHASAQDREVPLQRMKLTRARWYNARQNRAKLN